MLFLNFSDSQQTDVSHLIGKFVAPSKTRSIQLRYGLAILLPCIGFLIVWQVFNFQRAPYFGLFMASVVIVSLLGGTGPGLLDTLISSILGFLVAQPAWTLRLDEREDAIRIALFAVLGTLISMIIGAVGELQRKLNKERGTLATTLRSIADAVVTTDKDGNPRTGEWDVGAYQHTSAAK